MGRKTLSAFNFNARENVILFFKRRHPLAWAMSWALVLAVLLISASELLHPSSGAAYHGKAAWVGLLRLVPPVPLIILLALAIGWMLEQMYRQTMRVFDLRADIVIGPSGLADLDPWCPRALAWSKIFEIRRMHLRTGSPFRRDQTLCLMFVAQDPRPFGLPRGWACWIPTALSDRAITLLPDRLGLTEDQVLDIVRQFAPELQVRDVVVSF